MNANQMSLPRFDVDSLKFGDRYLSEIYNEIKQLYLIDSRPWVIGYSGGKDSTTALYLLKKFGYNAEALMIDLKMGDWSDRNLNNLKAFCDNNNIKLNLIDLRKEHGSSICYLRSNIQERERIGNCTICGVVIALVSVNAFASTLLNMI